MNTFQIPYGKKNLNIRIPEEYKVSLVKPRYASPCQNEDEEIKKVLDYPINSKKIEDHKDRKTACIVISDFTRPAPNNLFIQHILKRLKIAGIESKNTKILIATGQHPLIDSTKFGDLIDLKSIGEAEVLCHNPYDEAELIYLGQSSKGTPVFINKHYMNSELKILTGVIDPHQFVGFTGGAKIVSIGLAGIKTIESNHSMMKLPGAKLGKIEGNPVREDIDEIGELAGVDFVLNAVVDENKKILKAFAGHHIAVHREGSLFLKKIAEVEVEKPFDIIIASPGGYPKDIDFYQSQKAIAHAVRICKKGGLIVLFAECPDGIGDDEFYIWMKNSNSPGDIIDKFQKIGFKMGFHKAFLLSKSLVDVNVYIYSDGISEHVAKQLFLQYMKDYEKGLINILSESKQFNNIAIIPFANSTVTPDYFSLTK